jgi:hypothetical protein
VVRSSEGDALRARLRDNIDRVRPGHPSPIVPVVVGDEVATVAVADALLARGLLVPAIRPPTVAPGTCRLRVALSAAHSPEQVDALVGALHELLDAPFGPRADATPATPPATPPAVPPAVPPAAAVGPGVAP